MKKKDIIERLNKLNYDINDYWVIAGAALVLQGIRDETEDIDVACSSKFFSKLLSLGYCETRNQLGYRKISLEQDIEVFENWEVTGVDYIEGIPTASIESIKEMKLKMGREKDLRDVKLIDAMRMSR